MTIAFNDKVSLDASTRRPLVRIVIAGHVDHGKSTLIGRLLYETGNLPEGKIEALQTVSKRRGVAFEWSFLLDSLQTERDQGITIDTSQIRFRTQARDFVLIDAPGHAEFLRNMITGASQADAAILIVDATEGVRDQTRRHGYLLHLLGIRQIFVVINKMDLVGFDRERFRAIKQGISDYLSGFGAVAQSVVPISARQGDNIAVRSDGCPWYDGPTVLEALDAFSPAQSIPDLALRIPVQAVYKFDERRILAGRIESGKLSVGDEIVVLPSQKKARVKTIESWPISPENLKPHTIWAGHSIGLTIDRDLFIERGNLISLASAPAATAQVLRARVFWLPSEPLNVGDSIVVRIATSESRGNVIAIHNVVDPGGLTHVGRNLIGQNQIGEIEVHLTKPVAADLYADNPVMGRIVVERDGRIAGGGLLLATGTIDTEVSARRFGDLSRGQRNTDALNKFAEALNRNFQPLSAAERLIGIRREIVGKITFTTSFGLEDQAITHLIAENDLDIELVTLDTGRLFPETYETWTATEKRYGVRIAPFYPNASALETLVMCQGINGFYESRDARLSCCQIRKVEPLDRALANSEGWVTGLRGAQSQYRSDMILSSADPERGLIKINPILDWNRTQLLEFLRANSIPFNPLHDRGFASIGCAPCTRAIASGEPERAGRWWWEQQEKTECGLHA